MTVKEMIERLEKVEDKDRTIVVSDFSANLMVNRYHDIVDIGVLTRDDIEQPNIIIMTDMWENVKRNMTDTLSEIRRRNNDKK